MLIVFLIFYFKSYESYWAKGVQGLSMNEICHRTHISKLGFYTDFGSEDGLMLAILQRYIGLIFSPFSPLVELIKEERAFIDVLQELVETITQDSNIPAGGLVVKMSSNPSQLGSLTILFVV